MQSALSNVSSDIFKHPVTIIFGIGVSALPRLEIYRRHSRPFPGLHHSHRLLRKARPARDASASRKNWGRWSVTMQESFAGIRVIKSFAREEHQEQTFRKSNRLQFQNVMRITRATEAVGPLVETMAAIGVGLALLYVYLAHLSAARFIALNAGIFLLYDPIKNLSRMRITMERSIQATAEIFRILDTGAEHRRRAGRECVAESDRTDRFRERDLSLCQRRNGRGQRTESHHRAAAKLTRWSARAARARARFFR